MGLMVGNADAASPRRIGTFRLLYPVIGATPTSGGTSWHNVADDLRLSRVLSTVTPPPTPEHLGQRPLSEVLVLGLVVGIEVDAGAGELEGHRPAALHRQVQHPRPRRQRRRGGLHRRCLLLGGEQAVMPFSRTDSLALTAVAGLVAHRRRGLRGRSGSTTRDGWPSEPDHRH